MMRESWLPARPESATRARAIVREASLERGLDEDGAWSLMLATTEAVSNAILHGEPCSDGDRGILLRVLSWEDGLCVEVCDCGRFETAYGPPAPDEPRGRGIPLITAVVDHFDVVRDSEFTRVRFGKRRRALAGAGADARRGRARARR
jgi:anti-sigma regulatory factor (Ser/Thr protein kinase)